MGDRVNEFLDQQEASTFDLIPQGDHAELQEKYEALDTAARGVLSGIEMAEPFDVVGDFFAHFSHLADTLRANDGIEDEDDEYELAGWIDSARFYPASSGGTLLPQPAGTHPVYVKRADDG